MGTEFKEMKVMKKIIDFMWTEGIISPRQRTLLKNKVRDWWYIKTNQGKKLRDDAKLIGSHSP